MNMSASFDICSLRPYMMGGRAVVTVTGPDGQQQTVRPTDLKPRLSKEEWIAFDREVDQAFRQAAPVTSWLVAQKLRFPLPSNTIKVQMRADEAPVAAPLPLEEAPTFQVRHIPLPVTHTDAAVPADILDAARAVGAAVDGLLLGTRRVKDVLGLRNCGDITPDVPSAMAALAERKFYGPYTVVVPEGQADIASASYMPLNGIQAVIGSAHLTGDDLIMFQATPDVVRVVVGQWVVPVQWEDGFRVLAVVVPQVRGDFHGNFGVAVR